MHGQTGFGVARGADMKKENVRALADDLEQNVKDNYDQKDIDNCIAGCAANLAGYDGHGSKVEIANSYLGLTDPKRSKDSQWLFASSPLGEYDPNYKDASAMLRYFAITGILDWTIAPGYRRYFYKDRYKAGEEQ